RAADTELPGKLALRRQAGAAAVLAGMDQAADLLGNLLVEALKLDRLERHGSACHDPAIFVNWPGGLTSCDSGRRGRARSHLRLERLLGRQELLGNRQFVPIETLAGNRDGDGDGVAERIAQRHARGAEAERVLLALEGTGGLAHLGEILQQRLEGGQ